jgi:Flp pilus assembly protein TadG
MAKRTEAGAARARLQGDDGVAIVEFALVFPLVMALLVGTVSAGLAWNQKMSMTHAAREGARYGATVPSTQTFTGGGTWAQNVRSVVVERSAGELTASQVCVSLVEGTGPGTTVVGANTTGSGACIPNQSYPLMSGSDTGRRVQVVVAKPGQIDAVFYRFKLNLRSEATARAENAS